MKKTWLALLVISLLTACGTSTEGAEQIIKKEESAMFTLEVTIAHIPSAGESLEVASTLTYMGKESIRLMHGEPVIRTVVKNTATNEIVEPMMYTAVMTETEVTSGDAFHETRTIGIPSEGVYQVEVSTTSLFEEDQPLGKTAIEPISLEIN